MVEGDLRQRVEAAVLGELARVGPDALDRGAIVRQFGGAGISVRTGYRWIADFVDSGRAGQALARRVAEAAAARAARSSDPAGDVAREVGERLPKFVTPESVVGTGPIPIMQHLHEAVRVAYELMAHARAPDGKVRNAKLLQSGAVTLRQCLDTAVRISEAMQDMQRIEQFHAAVLAELRAESPALAERVLARFNRLTGEWAP